MAETIKIPHRKSVNHIDEYVERFAVAGLQSPTGTTFSISMGRDVAEVLSESVVNGQLTLQEDSICHYRLDVANITISEATARGLVELLTNMLANQPPREQ